MDRDGIRIAAGKNTAYDLAPDARSASRPAGARSILGCCDRDASCRGNRRRGRGAAASRGGGGSAARFRVLQGCFLTIQQAMALPRGRPAGYAYLQAFIQGMKASGFIAAALAPKRSGRCDGRVIERSLRRGPLRIWIKNIASEKGTCSPEHGCVPGP